MMSEHRRSVQVALSLSPSSIACCLSITNKYSLYCSVSFQLVLYNVPLCVPLMESGKITPYKALSVALIHPHSHSDRHIQENARESTSLTYVDHVRIFADPTSLPAHTAELLLPMLSKHTTKHGTRKHSHVRTYRLNSDIC